MSIAEQEAARYFPTRYWPNHEPRKGYLGKECYLEGIKSSDIQEAYEQGRTATPTDVEIEASAITAVNTLHGVYPDSMPRWEDSSEDTQSRAKQYAVYMLEAARKAVAE
jgi:hypothetical protein